MRIEIKDISFEYPGGVTALDGISLRIEPGEIVALVGENGSGKTTLARHLNGLLRPKSGQVRIGDWLTENYSSAQMARRVAYAFQNPDEQLFCQQVEDEVAFGPKNLGFSPADVHSAVKHALARMGLSQYARTNPRDLGYSGRKRVTLAAALAMQTPVIILDEPTASLDASEQELLSVVISDLRRQGKTIVVITHDMDFLAENLDRVVQLSDGKVTRDEPARAFFDRGLSGAIDGLTAAQIPRLSRALKQAGLALTVTEFLDEERLRRANPEDKDAGHQA